MAVAGKIEIVLDDNGNLSVSGGFPSRLHAFGMLTMAADLLREQFRQQDAGPKLSVPQFLPPDDVLKGPGFTPGKSG